MKNNFLRIAALSTLCALLIVSCKKKADSPSCTAGGGGNAEIVVYAAHNGTILINSAQHPDTAFMKYGTTVSPGTAPAAYDAYYVSEAGEDHIHVTHLTCGSYYIYRTAFDTTNNMRYTGGLGISFTQTGGEIDTTINVQ